VQHSVKQRATETGDITFDTPALDVSGQPLLVGELIVYSIAGTSPDITVTLETSSDLMTWSAVPTFQVDRNTAGSKLASAKASDAPYGRYVRCHIVISGTLTSIEYSLVLNTFASS